MVLGAVEADAQLVGDLPVRQTRAEKFSYFPLAWGKNIGMGRTTSRSHETSLAEAGLNYTARRRFRMGRARPAPIMGLPIVAVVRSN